MEVEDFKVRPLRDRLEVINTCKPGCGEDQCRYLAIGTKTLGPDDAFAGEEVPAYSCLRDDREAKKIIDTEVAMAKLETFTGSKEHEGSPFGKGCEKSRVDGFTTGGYSATQQGRDSSLDKEVRSAMHFIDEDSEFETDYAFGNEDFQRITVFHAMVNHPKYDWRSISALAKETNLSQDIVSGVIGKGLTAGIVIQHPTNQKYWGHVQRFSQQEPDKEVSMFPYDGPIEPIDYLMGEIMSDAIAHANQVKKTGPPPSSSDYNNGRPYTKAELAGHFVTSLRRYISYELAKSPFDTLGRYNKNDLLRFIQARILDTSVWDGIGDLSPSNFKDVIHSFGPGKEFHMTKERVQNWAQMPQDEEDAAYRDIDRSLQEMQSSIDNMNHHTRVVQKVNTDGERVIGEFKEALASAYA